MNDDELSALVAEKVMGWKKWPIPRDGPEEGALYFEPFDDNTIVAHGEDGDYSGHYGSVFDFPTNIADAWKVVERMHELHWDFECRHSFECCTARFYKPLPGPGMEPIVGEIAVGGEMPRVICEAALMALGVNVTPAS